MKNKNQRIYSNPEHLKMLAEEQEKYIGRPYRLDLAEGCLTIFCRPQRRRRKKTEKRERHEFNS